MKELINATIKYLKAGENLVMATVVKHKGSTPREAGARMIIRQNGSTEGTIGGGLIEAKSSQKALTLFESKDACIMRFDMTQQSLENNSMICGGNMTVLIEYLEANESNLRFFSTIEEIYPTRKKSTLIIKLEEAESGTCQLMKCLVQDNQVVTGGLSCPETLLQRIYSTIPDSNNPVLMAIEDDKYWVEPLSFPKHLILFGAGHVARSTAKLGTMTGFQVTVVDDRPELLTRDFFDAPVELKSVKDLGSCCQGLEIDQDSFLVILTRSHAFDKSILTQTLKLEFGFLGMIGSRHKKNTIYEALQKEGFTAEELERVACPIGLDIGANTPEELAVSIISQLIKVRAKGMHVAAESV